jgi:chemotaxis-related protein WspD
MVMVDSVQIDDCWNRIGVWSKDGATCPRLVDAVHCRNCDVYSTTGRITLEREIPQGTRQEWAERYAQPVEHIMRQGTLFTVFRIGAEWLAIPAKAVKSIGDPVSIRRIPHRRNPVLRGMANFAGELEMVVSLEALLNIEPTEEGAAPKNADRGSRPIPRMLRVIGESGSFAFEAAEVLGTYRHDENRLDPVPSTLEKAVLRYVRGTMELGGRRVGALDLGLVAYSVEQALK